MIKDLTIGNPIKLIIEFALPLFLGNLVMQIFQLSDMIIVGRLIGVEALAAVGATGPLYLVVLMVAFGFTGGLTIITAQRFGAQDYDGVQKSAFHCHLAAFCLSLVITALMLIFLAPLLQLCNIPQKIFAPAYEFMFVLSLSFPFIVFYNLLSGLIRALGDSKTPLYFLIFSCVLNILLNFLFIAVFKMGIIGSAMGTLISNIVAVVACYTFIFAKMPILWYNKKFWKYKKNIMSEHLKLAFPMALQFSILSFSIAIVQSVCNSYGEEVIAAFATATRIEQFATQPLVALGIAMATFTAQNWGAKLLKRIRNGAQKALIIVALIAIFGFIIVRLYGHLAIAVFLDQHNEFIINTGRQYLLISTPFYFFLGLILVFRNTIQGLGKPIVPLISSCMELAVRVFAAIILAKSFGYVGIFYAGPVAWLVAGSYVAIAYYYIIKNKSKERLHLNIAEVRQHLKENGPID